MLNSIFKLSLNLSVKKNYESKRKFKLYSDYKCLKLIEIFFPFSDFLFIWYGQVNIEEYVNHVKANSYIAY